MAKSKIVKMANDILKVLQQEVIVDGEEFLFKV
jgi:hypothetical protein